MVNLRPGRALGERELSGIRHLVASAVPGLASDAVTVVDGSGTVLAAEGGAGDGPAAFRKGLERDLEGRIVAILERAVGAGAVVARVTATVDATEVERSAEIFDPDTAALRSERRLIQSQSQDAGASGAPAPVPAVAGAAANQPLAPAVASQGSRGQASTEDQTRNYELSKTVTRTVDRTPRVTRLSVAVIVDGLDGKPRDDGEVARLGELAKRAVGFEPERGDALEISSVPFPRAAEEVPAPPPARPWWPWAAGAGGLVALALLVFPFVRRRPAQAIALTPGTRVAELEATLAGLPPPARQLPSTEAATRDLARELAGTDPTRAAHLLKAWLAADAEPAPEARRPPHG